VDQRDDRDPARRAAAEEAWARAHGKRAISFGKYDYQVLIDSLHNGHANLLAHYFSKGEMSMIYAALLRGINVGGNNKISMKELKEVFEQAGMSSVKTYINSGNIIFKDARNKEQVTLVSEQAIFEHFGLRIKVLVYSFDEYSLIAQAVPPEWVNDERLKSDVLFLWEQADDEGVLEQLALKPGIDRVQYVPRAILWSVDRGDVTKSGMAKIVGTKLYKLVTVRNVNTVRKIYKLMEELEEK